MDTSFLHTPNALVIRVSFSLTFELQGLSCGPKQESLVHFRRLLTAPIMLEPLSVVIQVCFVEYKLQCPQQSISNILTSMFLQQIEGFARTLFSAYSHSQQSELCRFSMAAINGFTYQQFLKNFKFCCNHYPDSYHIV